MTHVNEVNAVDWDRERADWISAVRALTDSIHQWAEEQRWTVTWWDKAIEEQHLGKYAVPQLVVTTPHGHLAVEPVARDVLGADGRVDIIAMKTFNRLMLVRAGGRWVVRTESGIEWPADWSKETFLDLVQRLAAAR